MLSHGNLSTFGVFIPDGVQDFAVCCNGCLGERFSIQVSEDFDSRMDDRNER